MPVRWSGRDDSGGYGNYRPSMVNNLRLGKFQMVFSVKRESSSTSNAVDVCFNDTDQDNFDYLKISHSNTAAAPVGFSTVDGTSSASVTGTQTLANVPSTGASDTLWVQVTDTGSTVTVKELVNNTATPTSSNWTSASNCYSSTAFRTTGGMMGFKTDTSEVSLGSLTISSYDTATSSFDITEAQDNFTVDPTTGDSTYGMASDTLTSDSNGNQTYDGTQTYTYDGWNRLKTVSHGYRDSGSTLHHGQALDTISYDAKGRRIIKAVGGTSGWDCTYHYYMSQDSVIEERNGSSQTIKQYVWGKSYIDELVQTSVNSNPTGQSTCDVPYWAEQDANWNVIGVVNSSGVVQERYEYTPYGQRQVFYSSGTNDPLCYSPTVASQKVVTTGSVTQPYGICEIGHQGLMHDEECGLVYDRARYLAPVLERFLSRDPAKYIDSMNMCEYVRSNPVDRDDPSGKTMPSQGYSRAFVEQHYDKVPISTSYEYFAGSTMWETLFSVHGFITVNGNSYGFYARSHAGGGPNSGGNGSSGDLVDLIWYEGGVVVNDYQDGLLPVSPANPAPGTLYRQVSYVWVSKCACDKDKFVQAVDQEVRAQLKAYGKSMPNGRDYNALFNSCMDWLNEGLNKGEQTCKSYAGSPRYLFRNF